MLQIAAGFFMVGVALYFTHFKRDLRVTAFSLTAMHALFVWGSMSWKGSLHLAVFLIIGVSLLFAVSLGVYAVQMKGVSEEIRELREELESMEKEIWEVIDLNDPEITKSFLKDFKSLKERVKKLGDRSLMEGLKGIESVIKARSDVFGKVVLQD